MAIESYSDLSPLGKIIYTKYKSGGLTTAQVNQYVTLNKISSTEATFVMG